MIPVTVDFDETLACYSFPLEHVEVDGALAAMEQIKAAGTILILNSERKGFLLDWAVAWCKSHGLEFAAVNDNPPGDWHEFIGSDKPHALLDLDNRDLGMPLKPGPFGKLIVNWDKALPMALERLKQIREGIV